MDLPPVDLQPIRLATEFTPPAISSPRLFSHMATVSRVHTDMEIFDDKSTTSIFEHVVLPQDDHALGAPDPSVRSTRVWLKMDLLVLPIVTLLFFIDCLVRHSSFTLVDCCADQ